MASNLTLHEHTQSFFLGLVPIPYVVSPISVPHFAIAVSVSFLEESEVHVAIVIISPTDTIKLASYPSAYVFESKRAILLPIT